MQFEDFDDKIRDAADRHHPAYNEDAWSKMKIMLDEHMPEKRKRRRGLWIFLFAFLLLGSAGWWITNLGNSKTKSVSFGAVSKTSPRANNHETLAKEPKISDAGSREIQSGSSIESANNNLDKHESPTIELNSTLSTAGESAVANTANRPLISSANKKLSKNIRETVITGSDWIFKSSTRSNKKTGSKDKTFPALTELPKQESITKQQVETEVLNKNSVTVVPQSSIITGNETVQNNKENIGLNVNSTSTKDSAGAEKPVPPTVAAKKIKKRTKGSLGFSLSLGADASGSGLKDMGPIQSVYGAGLSYSRGRFTLRSGFYVAKKIYTATPDEYHPDYPVPNIRYLQKIDADCNVYEIPVSIAYRFGKSSGHNWFAAAGLSSYVMKKETYDYLYKYANGQTRSYKISVENENKHLLSVLSLSAGYTKKLNKGFSLSAEPYYKLPLGGVGHGKMKLNSTGVLFTLHKKITKH